jgi:hypothetical protein
LTPAQLGGVRLILEGRGVLDAAGFERAGVRVLRIGRPEGP